MYLDSIAGENMKKMRHRYEEKYVKIQLLMARLIHSQGMDKIWTKLKMYF